MGVEQWVRSWCRTHCSLRGPGMVTVGQTVLRVLWLSPRIGVFGVSGGKVVARSVHEAEMLFRELGGCQCPVDAQMMRRGGAPGVVLYPVW